MSARTAGQTAELNLNPRFAFDALVNHPGKLFTLGALGVYAGQSLTRGELRGVANSLQDDWDFSKDQKAPFGYCDGPMQTAGLVAVTSKSTEHGVVAAASITEHGLTTGLAIVGGALPVARSVQLEDVFSTARRGTTTGKDPLRIQLYESLLNGPMGGVTIADLHDQTGATKEAISQTVKELQRSGIVAIGNSLDPDKRLFALGPLQGRFYRSQIDPLTVAVADILIDLQGQGVSLLSGRDILDHIAEKMPGVDPHKTFATFSRWLTNHKGNHSLIQELTAVGEGPRELRVALFSPYRDKIRTLLEVRKLVATDAKYREDAAKHALRLMGQRRLLGSVLVRAYETSRKVAGTKDRWADSVADLVPPEGISAPALHAAVCKNLGRNIAYKPFRARLNGNPDLVIVPSQAERTRVPVGHILPKIHHFPKDWRKQAVCGRPGTDPSIFDRDETSATKKQLEEARRICRSCPVRLACLKTALESKEDGIRNAMTAAERQALKPITRQRYMRTIIIGNETS